MCALLPLSFLPFVRSFVLSLLVSPFFLEARNCDALTHEHA